MGKFQILKFLRPCGPGPTTCRTTLICFRLRSLSFLANREGTAFPPTGAFMSNSGVMSKSVHWSLDARALKTEMGSGDCCSIPSTFSTISRRTLSRFAWTFGCAMAHMAWAAWNCSVRNSVSRKIRLRSRILSSALCAGVNVDARSLHESFVDPPLGVGIAIQTRKYDLLWILSTSLRRARRARAACGVWTGNPAARMHPEPPGPKRHALARCSPSGEHDPTKSVLEEQATTSIQRVPPVFASSSPFFRFVGMVQTACICNFCANYSPSETGRMIIRASSEAAAAASTSSPKAR